ncbi:choline dehydrogenase-like flavoprotein [Streptomyces griseochromogenes]|uniref:Choline dehydrogenase-like flavoprotein n=1 Tax=Streptomyces griseochromogenes TaxID=68214 RepID=Q841L8_9ACTN|nr:GMC family oxidoreductase [Streptomyces griseochromogenes]AAP03110.1 putative GMC oxidoreductase [Streptomyces griseochromogenes]ANP51584.1 oxidoreductase [Streptomyces griseochromogenes]MBP2054326.1 choline dehydrogenase-like flavoprotein [Streptomyces griseochromogenes]
MSLQGLVAALIADDGTADWPRRVPARLDTVLATMPLPARVGIRTAAHAVNAYAMARTGRTLGPLTAPERESVLGELTARPALLPLLDVLKVPVLLAAGTERMLQDGPAPRGLPRQDPPLDLTPASAWPARSTADAVVIGSGAGGAMAARTLARAGLDVVVLEEGRHHSTESFGRRTPLDRFTELYRDGGASAAVGSPPLLLPVGRAVGGTTVVNSGTCYRTPDHVLDHWSKDFGFTLADDFERRLDEVERTLRVATQPTQVLGANGRITLAGARELGWRAAPLRRNAPGCQGSCQCVVGCPTGAKQSVQLSVLPDACAAGARIVTDARVERILVDTDRPGGPRAAGVRARGADGGFEILAPLVVVAAGALQSPPLLRRSGLGRHPRLGRNLSVHPATSVAGRFAGPVTAWKGVLQSVGVEEHHPEGILIEATATPPGMGSFILPGLGGELRRELESADRLATLGAMIADRPSGSVLGRDRTLVRYDVDRRDADRLIRAVRAMGELLFAAGAEEVLTGIPRTPRVRSLPELDAVLAGTSVRQLHLSAYHPTGTVAAGASSQHFPVDPEGRLRGVHGVLVADASVLPSCPQVNPQLSIMAAALAIAELHLRE